MTIGSHDATSVTVTARLGIDIGGSGIKAALVDIASGKLLTERLKRLTPRPATPSAVAEKVAYLAKELSWTGSVGCTFPGVVTLNSTIETATNMDDGWIGVDAAALFGDISGRSVVLINDADAAALAEAKFGAARGVSGLVVVITLGTGIGSSLLHNGVLLPNTELGHLELGGVDAEQRASARAKQQRGLTYQDWGSELNIYLNHLEELFWPELIVLGGGISRAFDKFASALHTRAQVVPAALRNDAGIVGAALNASQVAAPTR